MIRGAQRRTATWVATLVALALTIAVGVVAWSPWDDGPTPVTAIATELPPSTERSDVPEPTSTGSEAVSKPTMPSVSGSSVQISDLALAAELDPIRFEGSVLNPPADVSRAGIWSDGADLAADGTTPTVIAGHVSDNNDRPGEFRKLWEAETGMIATTVDAAGHEREWQVTTVETFGKDSLPRELFLPGERRELVLITCADRTQYDNGRFHYEDNLVVRLVPVDAA